MSIMLDRARRCLARALLTLGISCAAVVADAACAGDGIVIDMPPPPPPAESGDEATYLQHRNGTSLGALALARYAGARTWPHVMSARGNAAYAFGGYGYRYGGFGYGGYGGYCGVGYPWLYLFTHHHHRHHHVGPMDGPVRPAFRGPAIRRTSSSFRRQPF